MSQRKATSSSALKRTGAWVLCSLSAMLASACGSDLEPPVYNASTTGGLATGTSTTTGTSTAAGAGGATTGSSSSATTSSGTSSSTSSNGFGGASSTSTSTSTTTTATTSTSTTGSGGNNGDTTGGFPTTGGFEDCGREGQECCGRGFCFGNDLECVDDVCVEEDEGGEGGAAGADGS